MRGKRILECWQFADGGWAAVSPEGCYDGNPRGLTRVKVYEVDPLIFPKCGEKMRVLAVIMGRQEIRKILEHPRRNKAPPEPPPPPPDIFGRTFLQIGYKGHWEPGTTALMKSLILSTRCQRKL